MKASINMQSVAELRKVINATINGTITDEKAGAISKLYDSAGRYLDKELKGLAIAAGNRKFGRKLARLGLISNEASDLTQVMIEEKYKCKARGGDLVSSNECKEYSEGPLHSSHCNTCMRFEPEKIINVPAQEHPAQKQIESIPAVKRARPPKVAKAKLTLDEKLTDQLLLSTKTLNSLTRVFGNDCTIATLCNTSDEELLKIHAFGKMSLGEVRVAIGEYRMQNKIK